MLRRSAISTAAVAALVGGAFAAAPASASVQTIVSTNWAGYTATGASFRTVSARWVVTRLRCNVGRPGFAAPWVGIGGFVGDSAGIEQTGTDSSCTRGGHARYSAWYELVPAPSHALRMKVRPGNRMSATVTVRGHRVTIVLRNRTTHKRVVKRARMAHPGIASAEWVVEAPSGCTIDGRCSVLPLGNFGKTRFTHASATTTDGHRGTISDPAWSPTRILLSEGSAANSLGSGAAALPSPLSPLGASFSVAYRGTRGPGTLAKRAFPARTLPGHRLPR